MSAEEMLKQALEEQKGIIEAFKNEVKEEMKAVKAGNMLKPSPELQEKLDKMETELGAIEGKIEEHTKAIEKERKAMEDAYEKKFKDFDARLNSPVASGAGARFERKDFICKGLYDEAMDAKAQEKSDAFWKTMHTPHLVTPEEKALTLSDPETGGYLAPPEFVNDIIKEMREITPALELATVRTTSSNSMVFPKKTGTVSAKRRGESETKTESTGLKYGTEQIILPEMYAYIDVTEMDLEDTMFNLESEIQEELQDAFAAKTGTEFISGSGPLQLEGILTNADVGEVVSGDASSLLYDGLINLTEAGLKKQYHAGARLLLNLNTLAKIRLVKANTTYGDPAWVPGFGTTPNTICGKPYTLCEDLDDVAAGKYPIILGNFKKGYRIGIRVRVGIKRLTDSTLDKDGLVRFSGRTRIGGRVVLAAAIKKHKIAAS